MRCLILAALIGLFLALPQAVAITRHIAFVQDDGSLKVQERTVHLYGIYIPSTGRTCHAFLRPVRCGDRAVLALEFKLEDFVYCEKKSVNRDRSINAVCYMGRTAHRPGEDLGAWMISQGWAVALPHAPFEYFVLERIARAHGRGIWGFQVDALRRPAP